ncbi:RAMP superfamily CRISPR-associated protein [Actinomyces ruminicola]|uniref:CRISPR-associated protein Csx10 n=1 Tax=Actinomyces ruminicola TaxID=332524 RepID=A0A1G9RLH8_9ACTO|nr:RAMP superfamily CRISPR-associated protein [Actinomyces ruminicola]SDM24152.1 CRISPR-associated protein Csx10 [Actinomyces ruminicola]
MSTTSAFPSPHSPVSFPLHVVFESDWGVSTGAGIAGGVDAVVEKDERGLPVVRGTVLAGVLREQAFVVAAALDRDAPGDSSEPSDDGHTWNDFVTALFGDAEHPRLVGFTDARLPNGAAPKRAVHEVVSLSIDEETGTAKQDFLRFFERAAACELKGEAALADFDPQGQPLVWKDSQVEAARLVLSLAGLLVRGIGSNRSDGDGVCHVLVGDPHKAKSPGGHLTVDAIKGWCRSQLDSWKGTVPTVPKAEGEVQAPEIPHASASGEEAAPPAPSRFFTAMLDICLMTPVVSYEVPLSNEVRSLDFLRGTVLLPWVHRRLRAAAPKDALVRDAVVAGDLLVSDATAVIAGAEGDSLQGMPVPLVLSRPKNPPQSGAADDGSTQPASPVGTTATNRLLAGEPEDVHKPLRAGYVFVPADCPNDSGNVVGHIGAPALVGRQSTAHDPATGGARSGQLFLVRALPAGLRMRATVTVSERLLDRIRPLLAAAFPQDVEARLGSRRLSGTYGRAQCGLSAFTEADPTLPGEDPAFTLWFTSDVLVRSPQLGPGGSLEDLLRTFRRAGAPVALVGQGDAQGSSASSPEGAFTAGVRHKRVDSWSAAEHQPRATRTAISAGSVLRVAPSEGADGGAVARRLAQLSVTGVGELTAQGYGRFVINHWMLKKEQIHLAELHQADFLNGAQTQAERPDADSASGDQEEGRA